MYDDKKYFSKDQNLVVFEGRVGKHIKCHSGDNGDIRVARFQIATHRHGRPQQADWHNIVLFGTVAQIAKHLTSGSTVRVQGEYQHSEWTGRDGQPVKRYEVVADKCVIKDNKKKEATTQVSSNQAVTNNASVNVTDDDFNW